MADLVATQMQYRRVETLKASLIRLELGWQHRFSLMLMARGLGPRGSILGGAAMVLGGAAMVLGLVVCGVSPHRVRSVQRL